MLEASAYPEPEYPENINQVEWENCAKLDNGGPDLWSCEGHQLLITRNNATSRRCDFYWNVSKTPLAIMSIGALLKYMWGCSPQGVGMGMNPPVWLKHGDVVEVTLENVGSCINKVVFETVKSKL